VPGALHHTAQSVASGAPVNPRECRVRSCEHQGPDAERHVGGEDALHCLQTQAHPAASLLLALIPVATKSMTFWLFADASDARTQNASAMLTDIRLKLLLLRHSSQELLLVWPHQLGASALHG
jgi:hypothetical protein